MKIFIFCLPNAKASVTSRQREGWDTQQIKQSN